MDIVVCLKQIPNPDLQFQIAPDGRDIRRDGLTWKTNSTDEFALEEAVRLKEKHKGKVTAITAGPPRATQMLREALAKGADEAVRLALDDPAAADPMQVGSMLAAAIAKIPHDLVLTGVQSDDYLYSVTGGWIAARLRVPHASVATKLEVQGREATVWRELEGGLSEVCALPLPAVVTVQYGMNTPRYAPLPAIMRAAKAPIRELQPKDLGAAGWDAFALSHTLRVRAMSPPKAKGRAQMITGKTDEVAKAMATWLREKGFYRGA
jgi:electron transfer flavoprotein beta subunit